MPAPRKDRRLRGTFKVTQQPPSLAYIRPPDGELNADQQALLRARPKTLSQAEKLEFRRKVVEAPWLTAGDSDLLILWIQARSHYQVAVKAYDRLLRDPDFAVPGSDVSKAAIPLGRLQHREAMTMISLAHRLGFSPAGRLALGVDTRKPTAAAGADDPWAQLRLVKE
jgi:phage terminase small subunit